MGAQATDPKGRNYEPNADDSDAPVHQVNLSDFRIGKYEITQEEWEAVMGKNPSYFKGAKKPVEQVSWNDCQEFIRRLNALTGLNFSLPTEAQWEYAARGGNMSKGYKYSGSNDIGRVAYYNKSSGGPTTVGSKQPNELGLYDMSGNVWEWCSDYYGDYSKGSQTNPTGPTKDKWGGSFRVSRGGSWSGSARSCRVSYRNGYSPDYGNNYLGLRLVVNINNKVVPKREKVTKNTATITPNWSSSATAKQKRIIGQLIANMVAVKGGTFTMGATSEQGSDVYDSEKPTHRVTLSDYHIGKYEVTQEEWQAVMGNNPSWYKGTKKPVESVSWNDCDVFIRRLNALTGLNFMLPTEAQWEYAARGGNMSKGYKYSGSNTIDNVAWYNNNSGNEPHPVGQKQPNELGLYDMTGNVDEWCSDWHGSYSSGSQTNPTGPATGSYRVIRGGGYGGIAVNCRVSHRLRNRPGSSYDFYGLRLVINP